jgi:4-amino-4-deoxy-L-arabinose transferase-like glycosyltransferase
MSNLAPIPLQYAAPAPRGRERRTSDVVFLLLMLPALVAPFVSFTYDVSPVEAASYLPEYPPRILSLEGEWTIVLLGYSFFIAFPILVWKMLRLFAPMARRWELRVARIASLLGAAPIVLVVTAMVIDRFGNTSLDVSVLAIPLAALAAGGVLVVWTQRCRDPSDAIKVMLVTPYLANAALCLYAFHESSSHETPQLGYWLTALAAAIFTIELAMMIPPPRADRP